MMTPRSFVIPVLDMSPHSRFNIKTLLEDLKAVEGEVICVFNGPEVFAELHAHPRIDKYCFNKLNAGVSRSWNLGINLAEGRTVFILNADLHVLPEAIPALEQYLYQLPEAVIVGPQGSYLDFENLRVIQYFQKGAFDQPIRTHDVSGFFFAIHLERFLEHKLAFDVRYSPCFMEEWDMAVQIMKSGLSAYTVPVAAWEHEWGISGQCENTPIRYFGRTVMRNDVLMANREKFRAKWFPEKHSPEKIQSSQVQATPAKLHLGLVQGEGYGWGVCSRYMIQEISKIRSVRVLDTENGSADNSNLEGVLFQALTNVDFDPMFPKAQAARNFGYAFFENELTERSRENAKRFEKVLGGSTWCLERMREKGIVNVDVLIQGIDPELFYPIDDPTDPERFIIFSGGKFELRKGQDLVLRAVKIMQDKYPDVWLANCWYNLWPASTRLMGYSAHIRFEHQANESWTETMLRTYEANGLDSSRIVTCERMPQNLLRDLYARSDIGLFPNRCEGGTNLVLMEYMACAKPVIASNASGHKDIVNAHNALLLNQLAPYRVVDAKEELIARWQEPCLDEILAHLEHAYHHRQEIQQIGRQAGTDLKKFTWAHSAQQLLQIIEG